MRAVFRPAQKLTDRVEFQGFQPHRSQVLIRNGHRVNDVAREPFGPYDFQFGVNEAEIKLYVVADHDRPAKQGGDLISDLAE